MGEGLTKEGKKEIGMAYWNAIKPDKDNINSPSHYTSGNIECIEAIEEATKDLKGIEAVCTANVMKYIWRWKYKNGVEDLKKAAWYLDKLVGRVENEN